MRPGLGRGNQHSMSETTKKANNPLFEYGPVLAFFAVYMILRRTLEDPSFAIYPAAGVLALLSTIILAYTKIRHGKVSGLLIFTTIVVCGAAAMAYFFKDPRFVYMKPTVINILFGVGILGGILFNKNVLKMMMGEAIELPAKAWNNLAVRWAIFFFILAALNEIVWRTQTEPFWVKFKLFGLIPLTLVFTMAQMPFILKHGKLKE